MGGKRLARVRQSRSQGLVVQLLADDRRVEACVAAAEGVSQLVGERESSVTRLGGLVDAAEKSERPRQPTEAHDLGILGVESHVRSAALGHVLVDRAACRCWRASRNRPSQNEITPKRYSPTRGAG